MRIVAGALFLVSLAFLVLTVKTVRRESRVRPKFDVARLVITLATALLLAGAMSVGTGGALGAGAVVVGFLVGLVEGSNLAIRADATGVFARRGVLAIAAWAIGTAVAQAAGIAGRAGAVRLGIAISLLSAGATLGLIVGRRGRITQITAARAGAGVTTVVLVLVLGAGVWGGSTLRDSEPAFAQEGAVSCPGSLAGVPLEASTPRNDPDTTLEYSLNCRWGYPTTEEGVQFGFGFVTADVSWRQSTEFRRCPSRKGEDRTETGPDGTRSRYLQSGTHHLTASWFESTGEPFAGGEGQAAMDQLLAQVEPLAAPCLPEGTASGLECSPSVGPLANDYGNQFDTTDPGEPKQSGFGCTFVAPYSDERGQGSVTVGWTEEEIGDSPGYTPCGNPPSTGGPYHHLYSATRAAEVTYSVLDGAPLGPVEAEAERLLKAAEGQAVPCPKKDGEAPGAAAGADGGGEESATSGSVGDGGDGNDDDVDPSSALGGTLVALLGGIAMWGTALGERGIGLGEVRDAWARGGRRAVEDLLSRRTTSVTLTGDEARAALANGLPDVIDIPDDQQWGVTVAAGGEEIRDDHIGRWGRVRGIGMVVETADGQISVTIDVDVVDTPPLEEVPEDLPAPDEPSAPPPPLPPPPPEPAPDLIPEDDIWKAIDKGMDDVANVGAPDAPQAPPPPPDALLSAFREAASPSPPAPPPPPPPPADAFTGEQIGDAVMDALEDAPQVGSEVMDAIDVDGDGAPEAISFDEDGDSKLDAIWTREGGTARPGDENWPERKAAPAEAAGEDAGPVPGGLGALEQGFAEQVKARSDAGYFVRNYTGWNKIKNAPWYWHPMGGQCGEFGQWGVRWSKDFVDRTYGDRAILDEIHVMERSSADPGMLEAIGERVPSQGPATLVDRWVYDTNHRSARIITPDGQRYMADYWESMGSGEKPRLIPEREWVEHWRQKIGPGDFVVSRSEDEVYLKSLVNQHGEEEGLARFRAASKGSPKADLIARSWEVDPW